jgi:hypothetical protein
MRQLRIRARPGDHPHGNFRTWITLTRRWRTIHVLDKSPELRKYPMGLAKYYVIPNGKNLRAISRLGQDQVFHSRHPGRFSINGRRYYKKNPQTGQRQFSKWHEGKHNIAKGCVRPSHHQIHAPPPYRSVMHILETK